MASGIFNAAKVAFLGTGTRIDLDADTIKIGLLNIAVDYSSPDLTATSMTGITRYSGTTDQTLGSLTIVTTSLVIAFDAADATWTAVAVSGTKTVGGLIVYKFVTNDAGSTPIAYIDGFTAVLPNGGDLTAQFDSGANRIFSLT